VSIIEQRDTKLILDLETVPEGSKLSVHCIKPDPTAASKLPRPVWFFTVHGAGEDWTYFDKEIPGHEDEQYSFAAFMSEHGVGTITIDGLGRGDSIFPLHGSELSLQIIAQGHSEGAAKLQRMLIEGTLFPDLPPQQNLYFVGLGHSGGGGEMIISQGEYGTFDAVVIMSMPADDFQYPSNGQKDLENAIKTLENGLVYIPVRPEKSINGAFSPDTPQDIRDAFPPGRAYPASHLNNMKNGYLAPYAKKITCPVLIALGQVDLAGSPLKEQTRYGSDDTTSLVQWGCYHHVWASPVRLELMASILNWAIARSAFS
jgi:hypothetical protein